MGQENVEITITEKVIIKNIMRKFGNKLSSSNNYLINQMFKFQNFCGIKLCIKNKIMDQ